MSLYRGPSKIGTSTDTTHAQVLSATAAAIDAANEAAAARAAKVEAAAYAAASLAAQNGAPGSATAAYNSEVAALASKNAAATSAGNAATSAGNAATSETNALASKNAAATSAGNAATSETNALASKNAAAASVASVVRDGSGGIAGLTLLKLNLRNVANTITSWFTNANTVARTYTLQDKDGTIADLADVALKAPIASPTFTGIAVAPLYRTALNTATVATGVSTLCYTLPNLAAAATYLVSINIGNVADAPNYSAVAIITTDGPTGFINAGLPAALTTIQLSGLNISATHNSGVTRVMSCTVTRLA